MKGKAGEKGEYLGNFSWVVRGKVAGADMPGRFNSLKFDLEWFRGQGIGAIVSLSESPLPKKSVSGFEYLHIPMRDMAAPSAEQIREFLEFAKRMEKGKKPVLVHCHAGIGRTGAMLACYLVGNGYKAEEALDIVRRSRGYGLFTQEQYSAVYQFESMLMLRREREGRGDG